MQVKTFAVSLKLQAGMVWNHSETLAELVCKLLRVYFTTREFTLFVRTLLQLFQIINHVQILSSVPVFFFNEVIPESLFSFNDVFNKILFVISTIDGSLVQSELQHL